MAFWQFGLFSLSISLICVLPRHSLSGLWKYLPNIKKYQSNYYYDFSHGDGLPRPLCPAALIFSGLSPYSGLTLGSVHCLIEFSGFYWKTSKNKLIGKGPGEVKTACLIFFFKYLLFFIFDFLYFFLYLIFFFHTWFLFLFGWSYCSMLKNMFSPWYRWFNYFM